MVSFPFIGTRDLDALGLPDEDLRRHVLRLANPLSSEEPAMTTTLLPGLLKAVARNAGRGNTDLALFEAATVTLPRATGPAPIFGVDQRPTQGQLDEPSTRPCRTSRCTSGSSSPVTANAPAGGAKAVRPPGPTRSTAYAARPRRSVSR